MKIINIKNMAFAFNTAQSVSGFIYDNFEGHLSFTSCVLGSALVDELSVALTKDSTGVWSGKTSINATVSRAETTLSANATQIVVNGSNTRIKVSVLTDSTIKVEEA